MQENTMAMIDQPRSLGAQGRNQENQFMEEDYIIHCLS